MHLKLFLLIGVLLSTLLSPQASLAEARALDLDQ
jgi:hypothetical protein